MIVNRKTLREVTSLSEKQIQSLMKLAWKYQMICDHHTMMGIDSRGYLSPMTCFNLKKLAKHFEEKKMLPNRAKVQNVAKSMILKTLKEFEDARAILNEK